MKKRIIVLLMLSLLFTGCFNKKDIDYYENISSIVIKLYKSQSYDSKGIDDADKKVIDKYLKDLVNMDTKINISNFIVRSELYETTENNSSGVYVENDTCFINKNDLIFNKTSGDGPNEETANVVCNGYNIDIYKSDIEDSYYNIESKKKFDYRYLGVNNVEDGYLFGYRSFYDGTTTTIRLILDENKNIKNIIVKENQLEKFDE